MASVIALIDHLEYASYCLLFMYFKQLAKKKIWANKYASNILAKKGARDFYRTKHMDVFSSDPQTEGWWEALITKDKS